MLSLDSLWDSIKGEKKDEGIMEQLNLEMMKRDLTKKYQIKNKLNLIFKDAKDNRS